MAKIEDEFALRYYLWSQKEFIREITEGFPYLNYFKNGSAYWVVQMMLKMPVEEQYFFGQALVKRFHPRAIQLTGEEITEREQSLYDKYRTLAFGPTPAEIKMREERSFGKRLVLNRSLLSKSIKSVFEREKFGRLERQPGSLCVITTIGRWTVRTRIEMNLRAASLRYNHQIYSIMQNGSTQSRELEDSLLSLAKLISLNSWLGISSETAWYDLTESEFPTASHQLATLVGHFLAVASKLLSAL